jgi:hypothetical protein
MKKFFPGSYLDYLFAFTVTLLLFSVCFTFIAGVSPLEALDIDPAIASLGTGALLLALLLLPVLARKLKNPAS